MPDNIYVAGFPYKTTKEELEKLFSSCGTVVSAKVILDRETGRPTGFGFIEMSTIEEAKSAVAKLNGADLGGRKLFVVEARPPKERELRPDPPRPGTAPRVNRPGEPGFVERRSGKDRRGTGVPAPAAPAERAFKPFGKKPFEKKPFEKRAFDPSKKWEKKPFDPAKKWEKKPFDPSKKWEKKSFDKKPFGKKPWKSKDDKPAAKTVPPLRGQKWFPKKD